MGPSDSTGQEDSKRERGKRNCVCRQPDTQTKTDTNREAERGTGTTAAQIKNEKKAQETKNPNDDDRQQCPVCVLASFSSSSPINTNKDDDDAFFFRSFVPPFFSWVDFFPIFAKPHRAVLLRTYASQQHHSVCLAQSSLSGNVSSGTDNAPKIPTFNQNQSVTNIHKPTDRSTNSDTNFWDGVFFHLQPDLCSHGWSVIRTLGCVGVAKLSRPQSNHSAVVR